MLDLIRLQQGNEVMTPYTFPGSEHVKMIR